MPRTIVRAAALVAACVFASLPALARVHDRLSARDEVTTFRVSKNVERPHEKAAAVDAVASPPETRDDAVYSDAADTPPAAIVVAVILPVISRAPPVR